LLFLHEKKQYRAVRGRKVPKKVSPREEIRFESLRKVELQKKVHKKLVIFCSLYYHSI
jgi:hypothetical protein